EREKEFVTAAKAVGIKEWSIIFKHIMPNVIAVIIVSTTLSFASSMLTESSLSFLGFGVVEPSATWGNMLTGSQSSTVLVDNWWRWLFPAIALSISTISINVIGDGLQAAIDPKSNDR
ncbi:MAG: ABC transporter permease, partial [Clostridia bacterium]